MKTKRIYSSLLSLVLVSDVCATSSTRSESFGALSNAIRDRKPPGRDDNPKNTTNIAKSWNGATLFSLKGTAAGDGSTSVSAGIEVTCTTCYVKGLVTAELGFEKNFSIAQAVSNFTRDVRGEVENVTTDAIAYLDDEIPGLLSNLTDDLDFSDVDFPPLNVSFNVDLPNIPESRLRFQFDELELYMLMETVLSAGSTYTLNLYSSNTPIGLSIDSDTFVGVVVSIDLLLGVDADIDISSGLHIKIDDGMALDLSLFGQEVSSVTFNGGSFEFLPVKVQSANGVLTARLRMGMHAGVSLEFDKFGPFIPVSTGVQALVYADLAEFTTNITAMPEGDDKNDDDDDDDDDGGCQLRVQQAYQFALGAAAGATLAIGPQTWGPDPSTEIPIFYTTLAEACAASVTKKAATTATSAPKLSERADGDKRMTTTTLEDEVTFTGVVCASTGLAECPASLRSTTRVTSTKTLVVTVASGSEAGFPATTRDAVPETIPFAKNVKTVSATSGSPVSYVPPPPPPPPSSSLSSSTAETTGSSDKGNGGSDDKSPGSGAGGANVPLIVGLSVGLGVPFLAVVAGVIYLLMKRRKYAAITKSEVFQVVSPQQQHADDAREKKEPETTTTVAMAITTGPDRT